MLIPASSQNFTSGLVRKLPRLKDCNWVHIKRILTQLQSFNPGALAPPKWKILTRCWYRLFVTLILTLASLPSLIQAQCDHTRKATKDNFLDFVRIGLDPIVNDTIAIGLFGEVGSKNYRVNGTFGVQPCANHLLKLSTEYLGQKLHYNFSTRSVREWMHQYALGSVYQYCLIENYFLRGIQLSGDYSRATTRTLRSVVCHEDNKRIFRRIAGSWGFNAQAGVILTPWPCSSLIISAGYGEVTYRRHYEDHKQVSGASLSIDFNQQLIQSLALNIQAEFKRPYNWYEAKIHWNHRFECGDLDVGIFGGYVWGKDHLPSSSNAGVEVRFTFGLEGLTNSCAADVCGLASWISNPAVYLPTVLAIAEEGRCRLTIPETMHLHIKPGPFRFNLRRFFKNPEGGKVTYTVDHLPEGITLSPEGILSGYNLGNLATHTVEAIFTATNSCGISDTVGSLTLLGKE